eukprot:15088156-Alexandrium_andersonii.AAC.1
MHARTQASMHARMDAVRCERVRATVSKKGVNRTALEGLHQRDTSALALWVASSASSCLLYTSPSPRD